MSSAVIPKLYQVSVTAGGTRQKMFPSVPSKTRILYLSAAAANTSSIFIGDVAVTSLNGLEIPKGTNFTINLHDFISTESLYVISATTADKLNILSMEQY